MSRSHPWMGLLVALCLTLTGTLAGAQAPSGFLESLDVRVDNLMREGKQRLAIGLVVPSAGATAFVSGDLEIGGETGE